MVSYEYNSESKFDERFTSTATGFMRAYIRAPKNSKPETIEEGKNIHNDAFSALDSNSSPDITDILMDPTKKSRYEPIGWESPPFIETNKQVINEANRLFKQLRELHPNIEEFKQQKEGRRIIVAHVVYLYSHIQEEALLSREEEDNLEPTSEMQGYYQHLPAIDRLDKLGVDAREFGICASVDFVNVIQDIINQYEK